MSGNIPVIEDAKQNHHSRGGILRQPPAFEAWQQPPILQDRGYLIPDLPGSQVELISITRLFYHFRPSHHFFADHA